jgi:hypothetical protein
MICEQIKLETRASHTRTIYYTFGYPSPLPLQIPPNTSNPLPKKQANIASPGTAQNDCLQSDWRSSACLLRQRNVRCFFLWMRCFHIYWFPVSDGLGGGVLHGSQWFPFTVNPTNQHRSFSQTFLCNKAWQILA